MGQRMKPETMNDYITSAAPNARPVLVKIRALVKSSVPQAEETISYRVPAFKLGRIFIYFAAFKQHIGIYPPVKGDAALNKALKSYRGEKGNLRFPLDQPMPYGLIKRVVVALKRQYAKQP
jgi:uncharacterized protein YdhG (YjbR/CyaY superfamily)